MPISSTTDSMRHKFSFLGQITASLNPEFFFVVRLLNHG